MKAVLTGSLDWFPASKTPSSQSKVSLSSVMDKQPKGLIGTQCLALPVVARRRSGRSPCAKRQKDNNLKHQIQFSQCSTSNSPRNIGLINTVTNAIGYKPKYVLDADISKCFDRINHEYLLRKANTFPKVRRQLFVIFLQLIVNGIFAAESYLFIYLL